MKKIFHLFALALLGITPFLSSCSDEPTLGPDSSTEIGQGYVISSFNIDNGHYAIPAGTNNVEIALISQNGTTLNYTAEFQAGTTASRFRMYIPDSSPLADGRYVMTLRLPGGPGLGGRLLVHFADRNLVKVEISLPGYLLDGDGTAESPYLISDDDSFNMFILNLMNDQANGAGLYFRQTADVRPSDQSSYAPGRGYWGAHFAGDYDGGGHTIDGLYYKGSGRQDSDTCFGLFQELRGHASVHNLNFTGISVSGLYSDGGIIAGRSTGIHSLADISLAGHMAGENGSSFLGGLIGHVLSGSVAASNIDYGMDLEGDDNIGGLFGAIDAGTIVSVTHVRTTRQHFSVSGANNVGGIIGLADGTFSIENVRLEHKVSSEDDDIRILTASGYGLGGIIGKITPSANAELKIADARVSCPVGGNTASAVGGIIGETVHSGRLTLSGCRTYSIVSGDKMVGGIFGKAKFQGEVIMEGTDDDTRIVVDDMAAKITGSERIGGFAGSWEEGVYTPKARVRINIPVNGTRRNTGGAFGYVYHTDLNVADFMIGNSSDATASDPVMRVSGAQNTGGFAGYMEYGSLSGPDKFDYAEDNPHIIKLPELDRFHPAYSSVVQGTESVGGVVGSIVGTPLTAISCSATVIGTANTGGLSGYFEVHGDHPVTVEDCVFMGRIKADASDNTGGLFGYFMASDNCNIVDCINFGEVTGGNNTGGIIGLIRKDRVSHMSGYSQVLSIRWSVNTGNISGAKNVGGLCGYANSLKANEYYNDDADRDIDFDQCLNKGKVRASSQDGGGAGGIVGFTEQRIGISRSANHGSVHGSGKVAAVGGIGGRMGRDASGAGLFNHWLNMRVEECVNRGEISCDNSDARVGGLVGYMEEGYNCEINNSLNLGEVTSRQNHDNGGLVAYMDHLSCCQYNVNLGKVHYGNATIGDHKGSYTARSNYFVEGSGKTWPNSSWQIPKSAVANMFSYPDLDDNYWTILSKGPEPKNCTWRNYDMVTSN